MSKHISVAMFEAGEKTKLNNEITRLQSEVERLRGRVAELVAFGDGPGELSGDYNWEILKQSCGSESFILRKQAEAVESVMGMSPTSITVHADSLRQQADKLEQNQ